LNIPDPHESATPEPPAVTRDLKSETWGVWLAGVFGLAVYVALLHWNTVGLALIRDEGEYAYAAWVWTQGLLPYADAALQKPPMIIYTYALGLGLDDGSGIAFRWLAVIFAWLAALVMGEIAGKQIGPAARWPARLLLPALMLMPGMGQAMANTEQFILLPILAVWWLSACGGPGASFKAWFAAGCFAGIAVMYKYTAAVPVGVIVIFWLIEAYKSRGMGRKLALCAASVIAGGVVAILLISAPFVIHDGGRSLYELTVSFNKEYVKVHLAGNLTFGHLFEMAKWWFPLILLSLLWFVPRASKGLFFPVYCLACLVATTLSPYQQYYMILIPCLAFAAAGGCTVLGDWLVRSKAFSMAGGQRLSRLLVVLAALAPNVLLLLQPPAWLENNLSWASQFKDAPLVAGKIDALTTPDQRVLIAGSEPQVLYMAKRLSSTRFMNVYPLMIPTSYAEKYQKIAIDEIRKNPPQVVVVVRDTTSWLTNPEMPLLYHQNLERMLKTDYVVASTLCQTDQGKVWFDDPGAATHPAAEWIVFVRAGASSPLPR
jgi:hypothetical protein